MAALSDATQEGWFSGFMIRTVAAMQNGDPNATALLINCQKRNLKIHTNDILEAILNQGNHRRIPNANPTRGICRAGYPYTRKIEESHVIHFHR